MKRRGCCSLLRLGKNSMGSNSVSQWKMFQFFNVVLQTGPCPALAPRTTHIHISTLAQAQCSASHPPLLGAGDGCNLCPTPAEQKRGGSAADTQPEASLPVWEQNAFPGRTLNPRGWVGHRGRKLDSRLFLFLCISTSSNSLAPWRGWSVTFPPHYVSMKWR